MQKEKSTVAKLRKGGKEFEILINPEEAHAFRQGKNISLTDILVTEEIYEDVKKGKRASEHEMQKIFGTQDVEKVATIILREGHVPLTEDMIKKETDQKRKQIITLIHKNTIDPQGRPHPPQRIETALNDAKVKIDPKRTADAQLLDIVKALREQLPLKFETRQLYLRIPVKSVGRTLPLLKQLTKILTEKWESDGSLITTVEIPAGLQEELEVSLNAITKGDMELKLVGAK